MTMTAALLAWMHSLHAAFDSVAVLFPHFPWLIALWGVGGLAMDWMTTSKGAHL